ncbi:hypothetical protein BDW67DRAFT_160921 [Aspergillus spinulosporus]
MVWRCGTGLMRNRTPNYQAGKFNSSQGIMISRAEKGLTPTSTEAYKQSLIMFNDHFHPVGRFTTASHAIPIL